MARPFWSEVSRSEVEAQHVVVPLHRKTRRELWLVIMPCLNEEETLATCIRKAQRAIADANISGHRGQQRQHRPFKRYREQLGARVLGTPRERNALIGGSSFRVGKFIVMGDADDSYDFRHVRASWSNYAGARTRSSGQPLPWRHSEERDASSPSVLGKSDSHQGWAGAVSKRRGHFHCGLRAFRKAAYERMGLRTTGMEFASEMVVGRPLFSRCMLRCPPRSLQTAPPVPRICALGAMAGAISRYPTAPSWLFLYPGILMVLLGLAGCALSCATA